MKIRTIDNYDEIVEALSSGAMMKEIIAQFNITEGSLRPIWDKYKWLKKNWRFTGRVISDKNRKT